MATPCKLFLDPDQVVTQLVADLASSVRGNLGSVVSLRQGHRQCVREAAAMLNLAPWQEGELAKLADRHAIARFRRYGDSIMIRIKDARPLLGVGSPPPSREEARERSRPAFAGAEVWRF